MPAPDLLLTVVQAQESGVVAVEGHVTPTLDAEETMGWRNDFPTWLSVINDDDNDVELEVINTRPCSFGDDHPNLTRTIPANTRREFGPFRRYRYNDSDEYVHFKLSGSGVEVGNVGVAALRKI